MRTLLPRRGGQLKSPLDRTRAGRGFPWYLRSFTKSPIEVEYPIPAQPMLVVYWARWADSSGETSRFSKTCVARVEGWTQNPPEQLDHAQQHQPVGIMEPQQLEVIEPKALPSAISGPLPGAANCMILQLPYVEMGCDGAVERE